LNDVFFFFLLGVHLKNNVLLAL